MDLVTRCQRLIDVLGVSVTAFCRRINISPSAYYAWKNGNLRLSDDTLIRIENYLKTYNF